MKKLISISTILWVLLTACESVDIKTYDKVLASVGYAYSVSNTVGEVSVVLSQNPINIDEVGIVWATKSNPTIADNRQSVGGVNNVQSYSLKMSNLISGTVYYIKAYYTFQGVTTYSADETIFTQNYDELNWVHLPSPIVDDNNYVLPDESSFALEYGEIRYFSVDKNTNFAKNIYFSLNSSNWDFQNYGRSPVKESLMRFGQFRANFSSKIVNPAILTGGGYYKQPNGKKFFIKDFYIFGLAGPWITPYPGIDAPTSDFGIFGNGYVLENANKGRLWRYNMQTYQWEVRNIAPVAIEAKFVSFDIGERAFILPESNNWDDDLDALYEYLPIDNQWKKLATFKGENRRRGLSFTYNGKLYYGGGQSTKTLKGLRDIWEYDPATDAWKQVMTYPGLGTVNLIPVVVGKNLYIGFGQQVLISDFRGESFNNVTDFWRFGIR